jgi:hypothetical protein
MTLSCVRGPFMVAIVLLLLCPRAHADDDDASRAEALNGQGKERIRQLDLEGAAEFFRQAIVLSQDPRFYFNLCYTLEKSGKLVEARDACDAVAGSGDARLESKAAQLSSKIDERLGPRPTEPSEPLSPTTPESETPKTGNVPPPPPPPEKAPEPGPKAAYGGAVGMSLASLGGSASSGQVVGAAVGPWLRLPMGNRYEFILDAQFVQRGGTFREVGLGKIEIKAGYLDVGAAFRYSIGSETVSYYFDAGLALSLLVTESSSLDGGDVNAEINGKDFSTVFGIGYVIKTAAGALDFRARYMNGYLPINDIDGGILGTDILNRTILVQGGYWF